MIRMVFLVSFPCHIFDLICIKLILESSALTFVFCTALPCRTKLYPNYKVRLSNIVTR